ncbi:caspase family protein [Streptomyces sp. YS415]|uniref:caspase family protein n=1 Tax=Streptomyces sp. YS415 TaxID=2944806 RepID=UPI0020210757|nr:caspase family protein [Streptomyces sp. YS415]MCL7427045.1 caspase family protein [Streptomyces sp. YS415]
MAIHIGLNRVDPDAYAGWDGALEFCENDALSMREITDSLGYEVQQLLSEDATVGAVFGAIQEAASSLEPGDICVVTYAGHGGQLQDISADEPDSLDETWNLFDREVLDDEIHVALSAFAAGVRVLVLSDSCNSGTVVRKRDGRSVRARGTPTVIQRAVLAKHRGLYEEIRAKTPSREDVGVDASVILISGCQDDQSSMEVDGHGVFTAALLEVWNGGGFRGDYPELHHAILGRMPPDQEPNYLTIGDPLRGFEEQVPFSINALTGNDSGPEGGTADTAHGGKVKLYQIVELSPEELEDLKLHRDDDMEGPNPRGPHNDHGVHHDHDYGGAHHDHDHTNPGGQHTHSHPQ